MQLKKLTAMCIAMAAALLAAFTAAGQSSEVYEGGSRFVRGFARVEKDGKYCYIDTTGQYVFDDIVDDENANYRSFAEKDGNGSIDNAQDDLTRDFVKVRKSGRVGILTAYGKWLLEPVYEKIDTRWSFAWKAVKDGRESYYTTRGWLLPFRFDSIGYLDGVHFDVMENGKWGVYNSKKDSMVIPFEYEAFDYCGGCEYKGDYVFAQRNGMWGILNFRNEVLVPFEYDHDHINMRSDEWVQSLSKNGREVLINLNTGVVDTTGEYDPDLNIERANTYLPPRYVNVQKDSKYGLSDTNGNVIIPALYDSYFSLACGNRMFSSTNNDTTVLFDLNGRQVLKGNFSDLEELMLGGAASDSNTIYLVRFKKKDRYGFYNPYSRKIIPARYTMLQGNYRDHLLEAWMDGKAGVIDTAGKVLVPFMYSDINTTFAPHLMKVESRDRYGVYDTRKRAEIVPPLYEDIQTLPELRLMSLLKGDLYGFARMDGQPVCQPEYDTYERVDSTWLLLMRSSGVPKPFYRVLNVQTGQVIPLPYTAVQRTGIGAILAVQSDKGECLYDLAAGKEVHGEYTENGLPDFIGLFDNGLAQVITKKGVGFTDIHGKMVIPVQYDVASPFTDGVALVVKKCDSTGNMMYGLIDSTGKTIVPLEYDYAIGGRVENYFSHGYLVLYKAGPDGEMAAVGCATLEGRIVVPPVYERISFLSAGCGFLVMKEGRHTLLDINGKHLLPGFYDDIMLDNQVLFGDDGASVHFPLLCRDNESWQYYKANGQPLPFKLKAIVDFNAPEAVIIEADAPPAPMNESEPKEGGVIEVP